MVGAGLRLQAAQAVAVEGMEGTDACVVCGAPIDGLTLPISADAVPSELAERETTSRVDVPRN